MSTLRREVLKHFKKLHRTRLKVFSGDELALNEGRKKINEEFRKNKHVTDDDSIKALLKLSEDVEKELRLSVIQAVEVKPGVYAARITEDTLRLDNTPYDDTAVSIDGKPLKCKDLKNTKKCS